MKKSIKTAVVATIALVAANIATIDQAAAGKKHVRIRNTIIGLGILGAIANSHRNRHYSEYETHAPAPHGTVEVYPDGTTVETEETIEY